MQYELGFIGGGNMAEAIVRAAVQQNIVAPDKIIVSEPTESRRGIFESLGLTFTSDNTRIIAESQQIVLAVKPQIFPQLSSELQVLDVQRQVIISIMAGVTCAKIQAVLGKPARIIRVMPNTPLMVGVGMSAVAVGGIARSSDALLTMQLFEAAGKTIRVEESALDAVTAVSGSGPAYVFYLAQAMIEAAESLGLSADHAALLTKQTISGAAKLMLESLDTPQELRRKVTSPGGTTQAAIECLESHKMQQVIVNAISRAADRSRELGQ